MSNTVTTQLAARVETIKAKIIELNPSITELAAHRKAIELLATGNREFIAKYQAEIRTA